MAKKDEPISTPIPTPPQQPAAAGPDPQHEPSTAAGSSATTVRDLADQTARAARQASQQAGRAGSEAVAAQQTLLALPAEAYNSLADNSRADIDAVLQSGARLAQGMQDMGWEMTQFGQRSVERGMQWASDMMDCRSFDDLVSRQRQYLRDSVDAWLSESARLLSLSSRMANEAVAPLNTRQDQARQ